MSAHRTVLPGRPLAKKTEAAYRVPRGRDGQPMPWVVEMARLRAVGHTSVEWIASRVLVTTFRIWQVLKAPDYPAVEILESLRMLEARRPRALVALADRADTGDPAAVRLLCELTGIMEPARPVLFSLGSVVGAVGKIPLDMPQPVETDDPLALAAARAELFAKILGSPPVDVIFREIEGPKNGNGHNGHGGENGNCT